MRVGTGVIERADIIDCHEDSDRCGDDPRRRSHRVLDGMLRASDVRQLDAPHAQRVGDH
jgi:hypothetical protein